MEIKTESKNLAFWFHLFITIMAWIGPFLVDWRVMVACYCIIWLQFRVFNRCLLNKAHGLHGGDNATFYSFLFEEIGYRPDRARLKKVVRGWLYLALAAVAVAWQVGLGMKPLWF